MMYIAVSETGHIITITTDIKAIVFLVQRLTTARTRGNAVSFHYTLIIERSSFAVMHIFLPSVFSPLVYVITWSTVDYTSVTSIIHCRHVITILFHDCDKLRVRSVAAKRIGVETTYNLQLSSWSCWWRLLFIVRLLSIVKI